jgi:hypothetical protein
MPLSSEKVLLQSLQICLLENSLPLDSGKGLCLAMDLANK